MQRGWRVAIGNLAEPTARAFWSSFFSLRLSYLLDALPLQLQNCGWCSTLSSMGQVAINDGDDLLESTPYPNAAWLAEGLFKDQS